MGGNVFIGQHKSHAGALSWTENELRNVFPRLKIQTKKVKIYKKRTKRQKSKAIQPHKV